MAMRPPFPMMPPVPPHFYGQAPPMPPHAYGYEGFSELERQRHSDPYSYNVHASGDRVPSHYEIYGTELEHHQHSSTAPHSHVQPTHAEDIQHYNPYSHPAPPSSKADAEKHMGPEAAIFYREMHDQHDLHDIHDLHDPHPGLPVAAKPGAVQQKMNFVAGFEGEQTPYEHAHPEEQHQAHLLMKGQEHHPEAHFDQGYWDMKDHQPHLGDEGHFAGEEHGEYHYIEPERTHHMGHYYSYEDDREHEPQHVDEYHDVHGIEHHPDDWRHDTRTHYTHHDTYRYAPDHSYDGDFDLHHGDHHIAGEDWREDTDGHGAHPGDTYVHDVQFHGGSALMHEVEHEFDELFHEIEHKTEHGVEHSDIHYTTLHKAETDAHPKAGTDFHADEHHLEQAHHIDGPHITDTHLLDKKEVAQLKAEAAKKNNFRPYY